jgi:LmbE family N-acetylglucosaminyl deacetylase
MPALLSAVFLVMIITWLTGFLLVSDFSVPSRGTNKFRSVFAVFPHADDECVSCAGFLNRLSRRGCLVTLVILTKGERGTPNLKSNAGVKDIRAGEARAVSAILGLSRLIQYDLGDGQLQDKKELLRELIRGLVVQEKPDLLITYDLAGFYGHPDHIACSEIVTELKKNAFQSVSLWYVTFPKRVRARARPPESMNVDPHFRSRQAIPTHKVFIGGSVVPKIRSWYTYNSQRASLTTGIRRLFPIWFFLSMVLYEYFAEVS